MVQCNLEVYKTVSKPLRKTDNALQNTQKSLIKGLTALVHTYHQLTCTTTPRSQDVILTSTADAVALIANVSHFIDLFRRQEFKSELKEEFHPLCTNNYPVKGLLFSSELQDKIKDLSETQKVSQKVHRRFQPYEQRRFPFLGNLSWRRGRGTWTPPYNRQAPRQQRQN